MIKKLIQNYSVGLLLCLLISSPSKSQVTDPVDKQVEELLQKMTLQEKVGMIHANSSFTSGGVKRLGIPELVMSDGPHGVRREHGRDWTADNEGNDSATYLPTGVSLASTWNPYLGYEFGSVLGREAKYRGKDVILGPGINIIRTPLNGRNFEYMSEDPYLISKMAVGYIKGVQDQDVAACVKHYLANNQELHRDFINVEMSERTLREIYLPGFKASVIEGGVYTLMGAYNQFRGQFSTHNEYLINHILKGEFGFKGAVISDWGAVHNTTQALLYGTDIEMGTELAHLPKMEYDKFYLGDTVIALINNGTVPESVLDDKVRRILRVMIKTKMLDKKAPGAINTKEHQDVALRIAREGIILLKNDNILPLKKASVKSLAVIGANAINKQGGGGGSSQVRAKYEITPLEGLKIVGGNIKISYAPGYEIVKDTKANKKLISEAVKAASKAESVILVGGWIHGFTEEWNDNAYDAEAQDKKSMELPFGQNELFQAVLKANPNTIIVLFGGGAIDMSSWENKAKAILYAGYPGMEGGKAIAEIIFGEVNPSGKLTYTLPKKLEDVPAHKIGEYPGDGKTVRYKDGIFVGYRYFDTYKVEPKFPFGHGLSYTKFSMDSLKIFPLTYTATVTVTVTNTGKTAGAEVVQVYVNDENSSVERPEKELKGFKKVFLEPGESEQVQILLDQDSFKYYDEGLQKWVLEPGKFNIWVGNSSRNILQRGEVTFK